jgi:uncharacterized protein (TIGR00369 family)
MDTTSEGTQATERDEEAPTLEALVASMPFAATIGMELTDAAPGKVRGVLPWRPSLCTVAGALHGGALIAFADSLGGICAYLNLGPGETTSTIESKTNFFRGIRQGQVHGVSVPLHVGRTTVVVQTDLLSEDGRRVAQVTQTQARTAPATS